MPQGEYLPEGLRLHSPKNERYTESHSGMVRALEQSAILEGTAIACAPSGELTVELCGGLQGVISAEETMLGDYRPMAALSRVGRAVCFMVTGRMGEQYILSRRAAQEKAQQILLDELQTGEVIRCRVTSLAPFGVFVDMGCGLPSLIGVESISVSRIGHPRERFEVGQLIWAVVLHVDRTRKRVTLSHRELLGTWEENLEGIKTGQTRLGIVRGRPDYGVFVELTPNLSGLAEPYDGSLECGEGVSVFVKSVLPDRMKVKLAIIDRFEKRQHKITEDDYFIRSGRLRTWQYSPPECKNKIISTQF